MFKKFAIGVVLVGLATNAQAAAIVFNTTGINGGNSVSATATFDTVANTLTLDNLTNPTQFQNQGLTGIQFTTSGGTLSSIINVTPQGGIVNCTGVNAPDSCSAGTGASPYDWELETTSGVTTLFAGFGSYKPFAIINSAYQVPNSGNGNLANGPHNPYLIGPVVFLLGGSFSGVTNVTFYWGTKPDITTGTPGDTPIGGQAVPEPTSLLFLGTGLLAAARKRFKASR